MKGGKRSRMLSSDGDAGCRPMASQFADMFVPDVLEEFSYRC
jgi:hypothetical protein